MGRTDRRKDNWILVFAVVGGGSNIVLKWDGKTDGKTTGYIDS